MLSRQMIQDCIEDITKAMQIGLCVYDADGSLISHTANKEDWEKQDYKESLDAFLESSADSQKQKEYDFFKLYDEDEIAYVIVAQSSRADGYQAGRLALGQIGRLFEAYKHKFDGNAFVQKVLEGDMSSVELRNRAKQLGIAFSADRGVFLIEAEMDKAAAAWEMLRELYGKGSRNFVVALDETHILLIKEMTEDSLQKGIEDTANMLVDMINVEIMSHAYVSYGNIVKDMMEIANAYREAKLALHVGKLFYSDRTVFAYRTLGIGRLIYQLPRDLCEMFLDEVFGGEVPKEFDEETKATIHKFFQLNLNVSETARQLYLHRNTLTYRLEKIQKMTGLDIRSFEDAVTLKIALMVADSYYSQSNVI